MNLLTDISDFLVFDVVAFSTGSSFSTRFTFATLRSRVDATRFLGCSSTGNCLLDLFCEFELYKICHETKTKRNTIQ
jgi:hypothetical protein